jgi:Rrf2 family protein
MKLSTRIEYGLRALIELAYNFERDAYSLLMLQTIAERQDISKKYLEQLFIVLRNSGIVEGVRGPSGGYRLAREPSSIRIKEIFELLEGPLSISTCLMMPEICKHSGTCATQEVWSRISHAISEALADLSLADLIARQKSLSS